MVTRVRPFLGICGPNTNERKVVPAMTGDTIVELKNAGRYREIKHVSSIAVANRRARLFYQCLEC